MKFHIIMMSTAHKDRQYVNLLIMIVSSLVCLDLSSALIRSCNDFNLVDCHTLTIDECRDDNVAWVQCEPTGTYITLHLQLP